MVGQNVGFWDRQSGYPGHIRQYCSEEDIDQEKRRLQQEEQEKEQTGVDIGTNFYTPQCSLNKFGDKPSQGCYDTLKEHMLSSTLWHHLINDNTGKRKSLFLLLHFWQERGNERWANIGNTLESKQQQQQQQRERMCQQRWLSSVERELAGGCWLLAGCQEQGNWAQKKTCNVHAAITAFADQAATRMNAFLGNYELECVSWTFCCTSICKEMPEVHNQFQLQF
jgi:hypothetical protein